jgi:predicted nucleotidyltransferase
MAALDNQMPSACDEKYLNMLKEIILSIVDTKKVMVFLFGSRVSWRHSSSADADIGLLADEKQIYIIKSEMQLMNASFHGRWIS